MRRQMLRILVFLVSLVCIMSNGLPVAFAAPQNDYAYSETGGQATVTGYTGPGGAIAIPATLGGYPVTAVALCAFSGNNTIRSVAFPPGVTAVGANAFTGCSSLSAVYFRGDAPAVGNRAFSECAAGITIYYPSGANGWAELWNGYPAQSYDLSATHTVTYNGNGATDGSTPVDPINYTTGDPVAVSGAGSLTKGSDQFDVWNTKADGTGTAYASGSTFAITGDITLYAQWSRVLTRGTPTTCTVNGITWSYTPLGQEYAEINGCDPVPADLVIPSVLQGRTVIRVGTEAFKASAGLQTVTLPATVETIDRMAFYSCRALKSVTLREGLTEIGPYAFYLCDNLVSVDFPSSLVRLGDGAFQCCSRLTAAVFAGDAPVMGPLTFDRCSRDFQIYHVDTAQGWTNPYNDRSVQSYHSGDAYTITYDINGGTGTVPAAVANQQMGDVYVAAGQGGMHKGYNSFAGWNTRADGKGIAYEAGQRIAATGNTTLYAVWFVDYREANNQKHVVIDGATWWYLPIGEFFCTVYRQDDASGFVTIPDSIDGRVVIGVYQNAFGYNTDITGVSIPATVTTVTRFAFNYCSHLSMVVFRGDAPTKVESDYGLMKYCDDDLTIYYPADASGWADTWNGLPAQSYDGTADYTVTYDGNGATAGSAPIDSAAYPAFTVAPVLDKGSLAKGGYSFGGWNTQSNGGGTDYQPGDLLLVTDDVRLYAQWYLGDCSITYDRQDGSAATRRPVNYGTSLSAPANPERYGYTFGGWYPTAVCNTAAIAFPYRVTGHATIYAKWTLNCYTVTYDCQGGSDIEAITVNHGDSINAPKAPTRLGFLFGGWYPTEDCNTTATPFPYTVTDDVTLYARWTEDPAAKCTVRFDLQDGSAPASQVVQAGTQLDAPDEPTREGYTFDGWYETPAGDTDEVSFPYEVTGDVTLYALWTMDSYTVSFDSQGGSDIEDIAANYGDRIAAPVPVLTGYNLTGWYLDADCTQPWDFAQDTVTEDMMLYAGWEAQPRNSYLSGITLSGGSLSRAFNPKTTSYTVNLSENTGSVTITPVKAYDGAVMTIDGKRVSAKTVALANGKSTAVTVKVTWNKKTTTYKLTIQRPKSTNSLLSTMSATAGTWGAAFNPAVTAYTLVLPQNVAKVTIKAARASTLATVSPASKAYTLKPGQTVKATIKVKSQSGATRTYTITITRPKAPRK